LPYQPLSQIASTMTSTQQSRIQGLMGFLPCVGFLTTLGTFFGFPMHLTAPVITIDWEMLVESTDFLRRQTASDSSSTTAKDVKSAISNVVDRIVSDPTETFALTDQLTANYIQRMYERKLRELRLNLRLHPRTKILFRRFKVIYDRVCVSIPLEVLLVPTWSFGVRFGADPADISVNVIEPNPRPPQLRRVSKRPFFYEVADPDHQVFERDGHGMTVTRPLGVERECYDEVEVPEDLSHVLDVVNTFGKRQLVVGTQFTHNLVTQNFDTHSFVRQLWVAGKYVSTKQDVLDDARVYARQVGGSAISGGPPWSKITLQVHAADPFI